MKYKRLIAGFMSLVFCLCVAVPSFAFTDEEWEGDEYLATSSNASIAPLSIMPMAADTSYVMTAKYTNGEKRTAVLVPGQRFVFPKLGDKIYIQTLDVVIPKYKLPSSGTYYMHFDMSQGHLNWFNDILSTSVSMYSYQPNTVMGVSNSKSKSALSGGVYSVGHNCTIGYKTNSIQIWFNLPWSGVMEEYAHNQLDGVFGNLVFDMKSNPSVETGTAPDVSSGAGSASAQQIEQGQQMIEQQENIIEQIINTTQTISNQLTAFWNQLAGEFTNLYNKMNQQHDEKLNADRENTEDIINELGDNTTTIVNNNNENTEKITNGYDNSGMTSDNEKLGNSMKEQEQQEQQILDQISGPMNDFEFDNPIVQYLSTFQLMGNFLQNLFTGSGGMQDAINLSFLLGVALMVAGLYRFKGGN